MPELTKFESAAVSQIALLSDPEKLKQLIDNARKLKSGAVERAAFLKLCQIQPEANPGTVEHDAWQSVHALEEMLRQERGRTVRLTRTRQKIARDGEAKTIADLTLKVDASPGFENLMALGHPELTFEALVLRHPKTFTPIVTDAARHRLEQAGLDPDEFTKDRIGT
jgi:hypothetical protein